MFEKEAEEKYCKGCKSRMEQCLWAWRHTNGLNELKNCSCKEVPNYIRGAEFGYNKANEWHDVKDGDYPKECDCCLLYLGSSFNCITGWRYRGVWYFEDNRDLEMWQDKVIAWKEIVLPKEIKEND